MGRQVGFYAVGSDHHELLERIETLGLLALPPSTSGAETPEAVTPRAFPSVYSTSHFCYLAPRDLARVSVRYKQLTQPLRRRLVDEESPVIEFLPSSVESGGVQRGRIWFGPRRGTPGYDLADRQYKSLARWLRRWSKTEQASFYVGPETAAKARAGELRLLDHRAELRVAGE